MVIAKLILLGTLTVTSYRAVPEQTKAACVDRHHCETANGENVSELGAAISQDLLAAGKVKFGDCLYIPGFGYRILNDAMHPRIHNGVDLFVYTLAEERRVGTRHLKIYKVEVKP